MLTLQVLSDVHLELHKDGGFTFLNALDAKDVDVLLLAGDIFSARFPTQVREKLKLLGEKYPKVLYVPGNHEFWDLSVDEALSGLAAAASGIPNVVFLYNQAVTIAGHRFIGGPMWFPAWSPLDDVNAASFPDFLNIQGFREWVVGANQKFRDFLQRELRSGDIVITHHLPSYKSVAPRYKNSKTNPFFVSEMDDLICERCPSVWVHGHTHNTVNFLLEKTKIVCNPFGYPGMLNPQYVEKFLIFLD